MRLIIFAALALSVTGQSSARPAPTTGIDPIFTALIRNGAPGCTIGVSSRGVVISRAYGLAELEHRVPMTADTIIEAGSVSKQFTAAATLLLVVDGKLSLDDDVRRHIPELPDYGRTITIDHLLNHTSGLRDWGMVAQLGGWPRTTRAHTQTDVLDIIRRQRSLNYVPGAEYSYTNSGYNLLTEIVQRVSGKSLAQFTRERLFVPLGMTRTSWRDDFRRVVPDRAVAYARTETGFAQEMPFEDAYGNGGLLTTVGDLLTWNTALSANRLGKEMTARLQQPATLNDGTPITYARGLFVERYRGVRAIVHSGSTGAYRAWLGRFPDQQMSVAVLCNRSDAPASQFAKRVADLFLPAQPAASAPSPYDGPNLSGLFVNQRTGMSTPFVTASGEVTFMGTPFVASGPQRFRSDVGEIVFLGSDRFRWNDLQGQSVEYRRIVPVSPSAVRLAEYSGRYASDEADVTYVVSPYGHGLAIRLDRRPHIVTRVKPTYADAFESNDFVARFRRDRAGRISGVGIGTSRVRDLFFTRMPDGQPAAASNASAVR
ncbi:beta-lactamase family protein [Sphingomonas lutea]|uniref:Beta-lactamase family protein n=1 Tax=Sphingomonas lutea TaxID=1045317 RepID=A0A7G9SHR4_9SPHN|nr:serine hydrolase domain-containing protein [Sphingomonas lutea]QNN67389.1 beta-lactamase family protein [Sphingomonas lutea]